MYGGMMAADSSKSTVCFIVLASFSLLATVASSSAEGKNGTGQCVDGGYEHDGRTCCLCGAGLHLEKGQHCTTNLQYGKCKMCGPDTYISHPNNQESCEPCTSCSQPNANQEVDEPCTRAKDTKCRCKTGYYCNSGTDTCRICYPCKECADGIKEACTANSDTICSEKTEGGNQVGIIVGVTVGIVFCIIIGLAICFWKRRQSRNTQQANGIAVDVEMQPLEPVEVQPYLSDIADVIGWRDMRDIAMRSNISTAIIESCQLDHPSNSQDQTLQLLNVLAEKQGREASKYLIRSLQSSGKMAKAERVRDILSRPNPLT